jgi:hypothetical protein
MFCHKINVLSYLIQNWKNMLLRWAICMLTSYWKLSHYTALPYACSNLYGTSGGYTSLGASSFQNGQSTSPSNSLYKSNTDIRMGQMASLLFLSLT